MTPPQAHPLPQPVLCEVDAVVAEIRARRPLRLHIERLARSLDVRLAFEDLGNRLLGLTLDEHRVVVHRKLRGARLQLVFAHELGHVLRRRGHFSAVAADDEEWFADWFARELALPRRWLTRPWPRTLLGSLHVDLETVAMQMAVLDMCPGLLRNGRRVLCRTCGTDAHAWDCDCRRWRHGDRDLRALPDIRELRLVGSFGHPAEPRLPFDVPASLACAA